MTHRKVSICRHDGSTAGRLDDIRLPGICLRLRHEMPLVSQWQRNTEARCLRVILLPPGRGACYADFGARALGARLDGRL